MTGRELAGAISKVHAFEVDNDWQTVEGNELKALIFQVVVKAQRWQDAYRNMPQPEYDMRQRELMMSLFSAVSELETHVKHINQEVMP